MPSDHTEQLSALIEGGVARMTPGKAAMRDGGPGALLEGWLPSEPLIGPETRVIAIGSCFAAVFAAWLAEHGYNRAFDSTSDLGLVRNPLETPGVVAQQFRWAFDEFDSDLAFWITPEKERFEATEERRATLRATLGGAEVLIITLGLSETWIDTTSGEPIWRIPPREHRDGGRYAFNVASVADSVEALETIERLRRLHMPHAKIVYAVSPVRFRATFRPISPIVADAVSKAILRAAVDEFLRAHADQINRDIFYFPSFEIVKELLDDPYEDNRHVRPRVSALVTDLFARHYTTLSSSASSPLSFPATLEDELRATNRGLEQQNDELQSVCDERQAVIDGLQAACDERLATINELHTEIVRLRASTR